MGLDMYLNKRTYIGAHYEHRNINGTVEITENGKPLDHIKFNRISEITERVGYWRKANHIHNWFVKNVQGGKDDCGDYEVNEQVLLQLLEECKKVQTTPDKAAEVLPVKAGFFFGGLDYDEYYMDDINETIKIIEGVLSERKENGYLPGTIIYSSSW